MWLLFILLSTFAWALVNVFNSVLVHNHTKSPVIITWIQSCFTVPLFLLISWRLDITSSWIPTLIFFGVTAYAADLWFFHVLHHVDVSIMNAAWSILSLLLSIAGFLFFNESWSIYQSIGSILIISGVLLLSLYHQHVNIKKTLWLLVALALLYLPYYIAKNAAISAGESASAVFFWMLIGREILSISVPLASRSTFHSAMVIIRSGWPFSIVCFSTVILYFLAEYLGALAYVSGPLSLVSVVSNIQPFIVMGAAWVYIFFWPAKGPKELITRQSISIKLISFCIFFIGLALISAF